MKTFKRLITHTHTHTYSKCLHKYCICKRSNGKKLNSVHSPRVFTSGVSSLISFELWRYSSDGGEGVKELNKKAKET